VHGIKALRLLLRQVDEPHGTNGESSLFDTLNNPAGVVRRDGVRLDDGKCTFHILRIIYAS
jgi:hypothetical protein